MAVRLNAWLAETFEWQLVLANHWLQERHVKKKSGIKTEHDRAWDGLYHDNGSCLEIINSIHPERNSALQVLETVPWTLTDGQHHIVAHLTPDCARDFATRYPDVSYLSPGSTIAVRKYTIQYTSYGPPRHRLRFLLHHIEWLGLSCQTASHLTSVDLASLYHQGAIGAAQEQLRETRAREDCRCLSVGHVQTNDTMGPDSHDAPDIGSQLHSQMRHTQAPLETQVQRATPAHPDSDDAQSVGTNSLAPVTLPNRHTKCVEIRADQEATQHEQLLQLLGKIHRPLERSRPTGLKAAFAGPRKPALRQQPDHPVTHEPGWILSSFARNPNSDPEFFDAEDLQPENLGSDVQDIGSPPWELEDNIKKEPQSPKSLARSSREALSRVSEDREITGSAEAHGNRDATDSAQGHRDREDIDPDERQDDRGASIAPEHDPVSECSWMKGFIFNSDTLKVSRLQQQCLTKDTSWLHPPPGCPPFQDGNMPQTILAALHMIADERASAEDDETSDADSNIDPSPDSLPVAINLSAESVPLTTQESNETDGGTVSWPASPESPQKPLRSHQDLPPDSSPVIQKSGAEQPSRMLPKSPVKQPDDEMEMEEFIPQALGEDLSEKTGPRTETPVVSSPKLTQPPSVVQVKETPYGKGKTEQGTDGISPRRSDFEQTPHPSGTSTNPRASSSVGIAQSSTDKRDNTQTDQRTVSQARSEPQGETAGTEAVHASEDVQMVDELPETEMVSLSGTTPKPLRSQEVTLGPDSNTFQAVVRSTKRKQLASPARGNQGKSKRREIRLIGFGDDPPPTVDPRVTLSEERAESLRRFREDRNSGTNFESQNLPTGSLQDNQSIDHQNMEPMDLDNADMLGHEPQYETVFESFKAAYPEYTGNRIHFHNLCEKMYRWELEDKMVPKWQWDDFIIRDRTDYCDYAMQCIDRAESPGPYYRFYKDKIRDTLYHKGIIKGRETLEQALNESVDAPGKIAHEPKIKERKQPRHDTTVNAVHRHKHRDRCSHCKKLGHSDDRCWHAHPELKTRKPPKVPPPPRKSLPGSFDQMSKPQQNPVPVSHAWSRQSLPVSSHAQQDSRQNMLSSKRSPPPPREQARAPRPSQPESNGDPYTEFYAAYQRGLP